MVRRSHHLSLRHILCTALLLLLSLVLRVVMLWLLLELDVRVRLGLRCVVVCRAAAASVVVIGCVRVGVLLLLAAVLLPSLSNLHEVFHSLVHEAEVQCEYEAQRARHLLNERAAEHRLSVAHRVLPRHRR